MAIADAKIIYHPAALLSTLHRTESRLSARRFKYLNLWSRENLHEGERLPPSMLHDVRNMVG